MIGFLTMLGASVGGVSDPGAAMRAIPVIEGTLQNSDLAIPVSASVRAATWDAMANKPREAVRLRVACIVIADFGMPGFCVPASQIADTEKTVDWIKVSDAAQAWARTANQTELSVIQTVVSRVQTARFKPERVGDSMFTVRLFEDVVGPEDEKPAFATGQVLGLADVTLVRPLDPATIRWLYPAPALRAGVAARVTMTCNIQSDLKLLCRDAGQIHLMPDMQAPSAEMLAPMFRMATYQLASILQLQPKARDGQDVAARQLQLTIDWRMPD